MQQQWLNDIIEALSHSSTDYKERDLLHALSRYLQEQERLIEQAEAELDGRMWSPKNW